LLESSLAAQISGIDAYMVAVGEAASDKAFELCEKIRSEIPGYTVQMNCGGGSIKSQMKRADRCSAKVALIIGEEEIEQQTVTLKHLHADLPQQSIKVDELIRLLKSETR
jgi:histidyl-tRNA synthetase